MCFRDAEPLSVAADAVVAEVRCKALERARAGLNRPGQVGEENADRQSAGLRAGPVAQSRDAPGIAVPEREERD